MTRRHDDPSDDATLVVRARSGDRAALDLLLRRHHDRLWALCRRVTGDPTDAADALQEALVAIARGIRRFDGRSAFGTWAYRVATNACLDELRRRRRRPDPVAMDASTSFLPLSSPAPGTEAVAERLDVDAALARLPHDFRVAVVLRDVCDLDYARIAEVLDLPPGTVRSRIARGRAQLAALLGNPPSVTDRPTSGP